MPFTYEPLTQADRDRMEALNIMVGWKIPSAEEWSINHETGDFLVRIGPDREPPHWEWHAFWWNGHLYYVGLAEKNYPSSKPLIESTQQVNNVGYWLEIAAVGPQDNPSREGVWPAEGRLSIPREEWPGLAEALFEAVKVYAIAEANMRFGWYLQRMQLPPLPPGTPPIEIESALRELSVSPCAIFHIDFSRSI
jgi:hypothetical protein